MLHHSIPRQRANGEERDYPYQGNFSKGLPHNERAEVLSSAYRKYLGAIKEGTFEAFEELPLAGAKGLKNPMGAFSFDLQGLDSCQFSCPPAPRIDSPLGSVEAAELYWMALLRDIHFSHYPDSEMVWESLSDLARFSSRQTSPSTSHLAAQGLFRLDLPGSMAGPYVSQYLYRDVGYISQRFSQLQTTALPQIDFLSDESSFLFAQDGNSSFSSSDDPVRRYIRNGRDLAAYVKTDYLFQAFLNAALCLLFGAGSNNPDSPATPLDPGHPYFASTRQAPFLTFGYVHLLSLLGEVSQRALKAAWLQKWCVHRRLRPEEYGGRVHYQATGQASYNLDPQIFESPALSRVFSLNGTYLLPQAYPFGSPLHPAYPSGHATVAGACATILKAWFDEQTMILDPVVSSDDGLSLEPYAGADAGMLTVGGELNKLAVNIGMARSFAGIHWRSDAMEGLKLGEKVAISYLREMLATVGEEAAFHLTRFGGTTARISG